MNDEHPTTSSGAGAQDYAPEDVALEFDITNEFAQVRLRKVLTRNGARLELFSPRLGYTIRLDALALESLTWQTMDTFSRFLESPLGPPERH